MVPPRRRADGTSRTPHSRNLASQSPARSSCSHSRAVLKSPRLGEDYARTVPLERKECSKYMCFFTRHEGLSKVKHQKTSKKNSPVSKYRKSHPLPLPPPTCCRIRHQPKGIGQIRFRQQLVGPPLSVLPPLSLQLQLRAGTQGVHVVQVKGGANAKTLPEVVSCNGGRLRQKSGSKWTHLGTQSFCQLVFCWYIFLSYSQVGGKGFWSMEEVLCDLFKGLPEKQETL